MQGGATRVCEPMRGLMAVGTSSTRPALADGHGVAVALATRASETISIAGRSVL